MWQIKINGRTRQVEADPDTPLLWVIREELNLTGTKYGCGIGSCGACTVLVDGAPQRSCQIPVESLGTGSVTTIEGLNGNHALQEAWLAHAVPQCGYCQSGQILEAVALIAEKPEPTDADIDAAMAGHLCRCGTYTRIRAAIHDAAAKMRAGGKP